MKNRIDHLEGLVKRLIAERQNGLSENAPHTPESSTPDDNKVLQGAHSHASEVACAGTTMIDGTRSVYRGGDEWYDVLEEVSILICLWIFAIAYLLPPHWSIHCMIFATPRLPFLMLANSSRSFDVVSIAFPE